MKVSLSPKDAAIVIQANYRGFRLRKDVLEQKNKFIQYAGHTWTCIICFETESVSKTLALSTYLGKVVETDCPLQPHFFHKHCLKNWFFKSKDGGKSCPVCRTENVCFKALFPAHFAASEGDYLALKTLIDKDNRYLRKICSGKTPLQFSVMSPNALCTVYLIKKIKEIDPEQLNSRDNKKRTALYLAIEFENFKAFQVLIKAGAHVDVADYKGRTPLYLAAREGMENFVNELIEAKALLNIRASRSDGKTALYAALESSFEEKQENKCIEILIKAGADPCIGNTSRTTPLHIAAQLGNKKYVKLLIDAFKKYHYNPDVKNDYNETPLSYSVISGSVECLKLFIAAGVFVNNKDTYFRTPLFLAVQANNLPCARALVDANADIEADNAGPQSPLQLANSQRNEEMIKILLEARSK
ncbi:MAG: hypothetical protein S4CHLAM7_03040 [Chlamydiae bacterium]|nr:hypothetical protein [Chlamydiota bacterium]